MFCTISFLACSGFLFLLTEGEMIRTVLTSSQFETEEGMLVSLQSDGSLRCMNHHIITDDQLKNILKDTFVFHVRFDNREQTSVDTLIAFIERVKRLAAKGKKYTIYIYYNKRP